MNYLQRRIKSLGHAIRGVLVFVRDEPHGRLHITALSVVTAAGVWFGISRVEWLIITLTAGLVISVEMLNTALEKWIDHIHPEHHPKIKWVKDVAAGAVLVVSLTALVVAVLVFGRRMI